MLTRSWAKKGGKKGHHVAQASQARQARTTTIQPGRVGRRDLSHQRMRWQLYSVLPGRAAGTLARRRLPKGRVRATRDHGMAASQRDDVEHGDWSAAYGRRGKTFGGQTLDRQGQPARHKPAQLISPSPPGLSITRSRSISISISRTARRDKTRRDETRRDEGQATRGGLAITTAGVHSRAAHVRCDAMRQRRARDD